MMAIAVEAVFLLVGAALVLSSLGNMVAPVSTSPWLMPLLVGGGIVVVSLALLASEFIGRRTAPAVPSDEIPADGTDFSQSTVLTVITWLGLSATYAVVTPWVGFEVATFVFLVIALKLFGKTSWRVILLSAAGVSLILPQLFRHLFYTLVP